LSPAEEASVDRRDFIKTVGIAGGAAAGIPSLLGGLAETAAAKSHETHSAGRSAMLELLDTIRGLQAKFLSPENGVTSAFAIAEGERAIAHILHTALEFWMEANPDRPVFKPYVTPTRKLLGDNPDSLYYFAPIRDDRSYRVTGNVGAATFTSFTIEKGSQEGHAARGSLAALGDDEMEIAPDGSFEIHVGPSKPASGNWLKTGSGASQITTRHYHESKHSVALSGGVSMELEIEPLDPAPLAPYGGDADVGQRLTWVANYVREHASISLAPQDEAMAERLGWISLVPNQFNAPGQWKGAAGDNAYGNTHAWYNSGWFELEPDEALVIEDRFPQCRFANVVLWNEHMQTFDFANRQVSLNRQQIHYRDDGSFQMVIAHEDPGVPNWLDTEGRRRGNVYWRFVFPVEAPRQPKAKVVKRSSLG
jgi:hypothetical protein